MRGIYVLLFSLDEERDITIGRLGSRRFPAGLYAYVGSALGGLSPRVGRHLRQQKRPFWHIDYLLAHAHDREAWIKDTAARDECATGSFVSGLPGATQPVAGFGSSDCRCRAHLFLLAASPVRALACAGFRPWTADDAGTDADDSTARGAGVAATGSPPALPRKA